MTNSLTYGATTFDVKSVLRARITHQFDNITLVATLIFSKSSPGDLLTAINAMRAALRIENQKVHLIINSQDFFNKDPANNEIFVVRAEVTDTRIGGSDAEVDVSFVGRLPARTADGKYPINWNAQYTHAGKITVNFKGTYTASGANAAQNRFDDPSTGAKAKCEAILTSFFAGITFYPTGHTISDPEETDDWFDFDFTFVQALFPNAQSGWDFTRVVISQVRQPMGIRPIVGGSGKTILDLDTHKTEEGGGSPFEDYTLDENLIRYHLSGEIPMLLENKDYNDMMVEWDSTIKPQLWDFIYDYFASQTEYPAEYGSLFIEETSIPFDITENGISPNITFVVPATGGIVTFSETFRYIYDYGYGVEMKLNKKDNFDAWVSKKPFKIFCVQTGRIEKIEGTPVLPLPPPIPDEISSGYWVPIIPVELGMTTKQFNITDSRNRKFVIISLNFSVTWQLVKESK